MLSSHLSNSSSPLLSAIILYPNPSLYLPVSSLSIYTNLYLSLTFLPTVPLPYHLYLNFPLPYLSHLPSQKLFPTYLSLTFLPTLPPYFTTASPLTYPLFPITLPSHIFLILLTHTYLLPSSLHYLTRTTLTQPLPHVSLSHSLFPQSFLSVTQLFIIPPPLSPFSTSPVTLLKLSPFPQMAPQTSPAPCTMARPHPCKWRPTPGC